MSTTLERYRAVADPLPAATLRLELSGAGWEHLQLAQVERPRPGPDDIAFRVDVNSICFSDVKIIGAGPAHPRLTKYDVAKDKVVPGHECAITVVEVGAQAADRYQVGQRFIVQADMLKYNAAVGYDIHGCMAQYGVFDRRVQEYLIPVRPDSGYSEVALVEPWACVEASYHRVDIGPRDQVVWFCGGGGPMGQMHVVRTVGLKKAGKAPTLNTMILTDISDERLQACIERYTPMAAAVGLKFIGINPQHPDAEAQLDAAAPDGVDYLIALAPIAEVTLAAMKRVRQYGVVNLFAGFKRGTGPLNMGDIHYDQLTVTGNSGSRIEDMEIVLRKVEAGELDTDSSVYAVVGLKAAKQAIQAVADAQATNKVLIYPQLPHLPFLPITELPKHIAFPPEVAERVRAGYWSAAAEAAFLETGLNNAWGTAA